MAVIDQVLVEISNLVARQVDTTTLVNPSGTIVPPTASTIDPVGTSGLVPTPSNSPASSNNNNPSNPNSPLLFFVALGFGVVFTNLWIIVGVKYCFRYNARNRQMRLNEDGEPINLENMPRPHRRRREKKLMTMDEVNDKFPMMKYKTWISERAREGLPTAGGVSAPPSRANSVRSVEGVIPDLANKERDSSDGRPKTSDTTRVGLNAERKTEAEKKDARDAPTIPPAGQTSDSAAPTTVPLQRAHSQSDDDDDEHINAALPPECMGTSGDTCAICIETLEDDDDVRGLSCGHAFHAVCVDPWLTSRRACCPLCKADYYVPKPRPPPADGDAAAANPNGQDLARTGSRGNMPNAPPAAWYNLRGHRRILPFSGRSVPAVAVVTDPQANQQRSGRRRAEQTAAAESQPEPAPAPLVQEERSGNVLSNIRQALPTLRFGRRERNDGERPSDPAAATSNVTPSQLEAGNRAAPVTAPTQS